MLTMSTLSLIKRNLLIFIAISATLYLVDCLMTQPSPTSFNASSSAFQTQTVLAATNPNTNENKGASLLASFRPNHVAISVSNFDESVRWYQEKLGFRVTKITRIPEISAQRAWLDLNGFVMEIFVRPQSTQFNPPLRMIEDGMLAQGYFHVAFTVDNLDAVVVELHRRGVKFFFEPKIFESDKQKVCFIKDNNGNPIELVQLLT